MCRYMLTILLSDAHPVLTNNALTPPMPALYLGIAQKAKYRDCRNFKIYIKKTY